MAGAHIDTPPELLVGKETGGLSPWRVFDDKKKLSLDRCWLKLCRLLIAQTCSDEELDQAKLQVVIADRSGGRYSYVCSSDFGNNCYTLANEKIFR